MKVQSGATDQDKLLSEWHKQAWVKRLFLPGDFLEQVSMDGAENMVCHKTTMEYLSMIDQVETKTVKVSESRRHSTDLDYRPQEFKDETLKIITNAAEVTCRRCSGGGRSTCGNCSGDGKVTCGKCSGRGEVNCDTTKNCGSCGGSGKRQENCGSCGGRGKHENKCGTCGGGGVTGRGGSGAGPCYSCGGSGKHSRDCGSCSGGKITRNCSRCSGGKVTCDRCGGRGRVGCDRCNRSGILTCNRCNGSGSVICRTCDGAGELVKGDIITRKFSCSTDLTYRLSGLATNEFKNGLAARHFESITGDLVREELQTPASRDLVLQRQTLHSYDVLSHRYSYEGAEFWLNRITSSNGLKYVALDMPFSKTRAAIAGAAFVIAMAAVSALLIFV